MRPTGEAERARKTVTRDLIAEIRSLDARLKSSCKVIAEQVENSGSSLTDVVGIGPIIAGRIIARTGAPSRFSNSGSYASYVGAAPIEVASADHSRHRLSRTGDRQLNSALHTAAVTQIRMTGSRGNLYYLTKLAEGKTPREARRCLKRRLADHVWRTMIARRESPGGEPRRTPGGDSAIQRGWYYPVHQPFGQVTSQARHREVYEATMCLPVTPVASRARAPSPPRFFLGSSEPTRHRRRARRRGK